MLALATLLALSAAVSAPPRAPPSAAPLRTLRVDYVHSGKAGDERFVPWTEWLSKAPGPAPRTGSSTTAGSASTGLR
jgi:hypothetical protein